VRGDNSNNNSSSKATPTVPSTLPSSASTLDWRQPGLVGLN
jgi:hypothetical protein